MRRTENKLMAAAKGGFTLVELLVVVATRHSRDDRPAGRHETPETTRKTAAKTADNLRGAVTNYMIDKKKSTPPNDLKVLIDPNGDEDPYIEGGEGALADPWDNPYRIEVKGKRFVVISDGPDGQPNTEDDIRSDKIAKTAK